MISCASPVFTSRESSSAQPPFKTTGSFYFLPKAKIRIQIVAGPTDYSFKYVETIIAPDEKTLRLLDYNQNFLSSLYSDIWEIKLTNNGLLNKISTTVEDKTGEVIVKIVDIGKEALKIASLPYPSGDVSKGFIFLDLTFSPSELEEGDGKQIITPGTTTETITETTKTKETTTGTTPSTTKVTKDITTETYIPPATNPPNVKTVTTTTEINNETNEANPTISKITTETTTGSISRPERIFTIKLIPDSATPPENSTGGANTEAEAGQDTNEAGCNGISFRPLKPYMLQCFENVENSHERLLVDQRFLLLPDERTEICLPINRAAFIKKITNLTFDNGILTEVHMEKPSEASGFWDIPLSIVKGIASVPAELLQFKIDYSNKEKTLADAQKAELDAKKALLDYQKKVIENEKSRR